MPPVVPFAERLEIVRHISFVDEVHAETVPDKLDTWREVGFDVYFKGDDWRATEKRSAARGGVRRGRGRSRLLPVHGPHVEHRTAARAPVTEPGRRGRTGPDDEGGMTRDAAVPPAKERFAEVVARLAAAQKRRAPGSPAYSIYVNRPIGRRLAAAAYLAGLTPNAVTAISAVFTFSAIAVIALTPPTPLTGVGIGLLLILGYALDAADGQLARLRGGGSPAGEWLDHVVDAAKLSSLHLAVLVGWLRFLELPSPALLLVPLGFAIVAAVLFFAMILNDFLRARATGAPSPNRRAEASAHCSSSRPTTASSASRSSSLECPSFSCRCTVSCSSRTRHSLWSRSRSGSVRSVGSRGDGMGPPHPSADHDQTAASAGSTPHGGLLSGLRVLVAHPGAELYGSDRVVLESVVAIVNAGATRGGHRCPRRGRSSSELDTPSRRRSPDVRSS